MSFHSIVQVRRSSHYWRRKRLSFPFKSKRSNERFADIPLCYNRRRMVRADAERCICTTDSICCAMIRDVAVFVMWLQHCHVLNPPVITGSGATRRVRSAPPVCRFLLHPAMADPHHNCLVSSNTLTNFSDG
ncbi:hypothetical protein TNCV_740221 [Trichonephila clavipes]|nr:hypothetical protein TNCV_740221 [Trichonephila clavipes]